MERKNNKCLLKSIKHTSNKIPNIPSQLLQLVGDFHIAHGRSFYHQEHNKSPRYFYPPHPSGHGFCLLIRWYVKREIWRTTFITSPWIDCTNELNSYNMLVQILSNRCQLLRPLLQACGQRCCGLPSVALVSPLSPNETVWEKILLSQSAKGGVFVPHISIFINILPLHGVQMMTNNQSQAGISLFIIFIQ